MSHNEHIFLKNKIGIPHSHSLLKNLQNNVWFVAIRQTITELHLFEVDRVVPGNNTRFGTHQVMYAKLC